MQNLNPTQVKLLKAFVQKLYLNGGIVVYDSADFPALDYIRVDASGVFKITNQKQLFDYLMWHAKQLDLTDILNEPDQNVAYEAFTQRIRDAIIDGDLNNVDFLELDLDSINIK